MATPIVIPPSAANSYNLDYCSMAVLKNPHINNPPLDPNTAFPLIPPQLLNQNACNPTLWGLDVYKIFAWKALVFLNWGAGALAVLLTVYAGLLYISGFANEANVKKAKSILIACYVGLAIVFSARIILYGTWQAFSNTSGFDPNSVNVEIQSSATAAPAP